MNDPKKITKSKAIADAVDSQKLIGDKVNVESLVTDKSLATIEQLDNAGPLAGIDLSIATTVLDSSSVLVDAEKLVVIEPLVAATSLATDESLATANPLAVGAGTTVPNEGSDVKISESLEPLKKTIVIFLGPYQRYSRGDKAGFSADYAETLVARNIACWPKDYASKSKGNSHGYDFGI